MIQRIQTLFLLLAAVCSGLLFYFPFATGEVAQSSSIMSDGVYNLQDNIGVLVLFAAAAVLSLGALISFKNRTNQALLSRFSFIANLIGIILAVVLFFNDRQNMGNVDEADGIGLYLPFAAIVFLLLAMRYIKKDSDLVSSMDRLR